jgi:meckelin
MDWEKPRKVQLEDKHESVVAWRSAFIANELNEIQVEKRKIPPETLLIWFAMLWVGLGWGNICQTNPDFSIYYKDLQPYNMILKFFLCSFLTFCIVLVQLCLYWLYNLVTETPLQQFTDLCSVSNVSILILPHKIHGYYIHGKAPWQQSDLPISWLKAELDKER